MHRILLTALLAGFVAGIVSFGIQQTKLVPLILQAETYENSETDDHHHDHAEPATNLKRAGYTLLTDIGVGVGYGLLLVGAFSLVGGKIDTQKGIMWGIAGFATFALAPSFGLPPELPSSMTADLEARQIWWVATAIATASGLALLVFAPKFFGKFGGVALILLPHLVGHPAPVTIGGAVPPELNASFAAASLGVAAIFWVVLGAVSGWLYSSHLWTQPLRQ